MVAIRYHIRGEMVRSSREDMILRGSEVLPLGSRQYAETGTMRSKLYKEMDKKKQKVEVGVGISMHCGDKWERRTVSEWPRD